MGKTSAWGHSNPATHVLKTEGDYRYGFGCRIRFIISDMKCRYMNEMNAPSVRPTGLGLTDYKVRTKPA